jgi:tripartite-type tricarboxylate transporter receptor subunit TctC
VIGVGHSSKNRLLISIRRHWSETMTIKLLRACLATLLIAGIATIGALAGVARADDWPARPIRLINPWPPGGPADIVARPVMEKLSTALGQPVVIENKAGANGTIGANFVAKAAPDGYTLLFSHVGPIAISPAIDPGLLYDPLKDLAPITQLVSGPTVLVVRPELPITSIAELIDYAKHDPGKLTYGSVGPGSTTHLAGEMLHMMADIDIVHVPYKGAAPVLIDLLAGQIDMAFLNVSGALPQIRAGKLRPIAVTTLKPSSVLPELPTVAATLPGFEVNSWYGMMAPAGTPKPIIDRLYREIAAILKQPDIIERLRQSGLEPEGSTPEQHAADIREDLIRWEKLVKQTGAVKWN